MIPPATNLTADHVRSGPYIPPVSRVLLYSPGDWEAFISEWLECPALASRYTVVQRLGGAGDEGRDVVGYCGDPKLNPPWDNYQCKRYTKGPLAPTDIYVEIGKLLWYTFQGSYPVPRKYYFVSPKDAGTKLWDLLRKPDELKQTLIQKWDKYCKDDVYSKPIELVGNFETYVKAFNFAVFDAVPVAQIIEQHKTSAHHVVRFGGGLPPKPPAQVPPQAIQENEARYVAQLLEAYGDAQGSVLTEPSQIQDSHHVDHFARSREDFYRSETLRVFSRSTLPPGTFEELQDFICSSVIDTCRSQFANGYERVKQTTKEARQLPIESHPLKSCLNPHEKSGICHQLANEDKLVWVPKKNNV